MELKDFVTKITSLALIFSGIYQIFLSLNAIFFIYPHLNPGYVHSSPVTQRGLIEKALLLYVTMVISGVYGIALLLKPSKEVEIIHIILGILLTVASIFLITKTPFTTDPMQQFLLKLMGNFL